MLKAKDLRDQTKEELEAMLQDIKKELYELKNQLRQTKKIEKPHLLVEKKKDVAKLLTVLSEKELAEQR